MPSLGGLVGCHFWVPWHAGMLWMDLVPLGAISECHCLVPWWAFVGCHGGVPCDEHL